MWVDARFPLRSAILRPAHPKTCKCGACGAEVERLLDFGYQLPDCVWDLPEHERSPRNSTDFAELGERRFVRGLLPIKLEDGAEFRYGVWLEVEPDTFGKIVSVWNDKRRYPRLRFRAKIANAAPPFGKKLLGRVVRACVRDQGSRPFVTSAKKAWLQTLLERGWTLAEYRAALATFG